MLYGPEMADDLIRSRVIPEQAPLRVVPAIRPGKYPDPSLIDSDGASSGEYGSFQAARLLDPLNGSAGYPVLGSECAKG
jgi:hypothetical protein